MSKKRVQLYEEPLPDGRCKYRLPYLDPMTHKKRTLSLVLEKQTASNYKMALRELQGRLDEIMEMSEDKDITLRRLCELYFAEKSYILKESTLIRNKATLERLRRWMGDDVLVNSLTVPFVKQIIMQHSEENHTYNEYLTRFKALLRWGYINGYLEDKNVIDRLTALPDDKKARIEDKYLEKEDLKKLLDASIDVPHWHYVIHFMALSGLRVGEVISLKDKDIDAEYIHVRSTYEINADKIDTPKTRTSERDVYLRVELDNLVKQIRAYYKRYKFKNGIQSRYFMCGKDGDILSYYSFNKYLKELSERVLGRRITSHALRHTAASLLIAEGVPLETVSRMLGHDNSKVTQEIYFHITKTLRNRDNNMLRNISIL